MAFSPGSWHFLLIPASVFLQLLSSSLWEIAGCVCRAHDTRFLPRGRGAGAGYVSNGSGWGWSREGACRACWKAPERARIVGSQPRGASLGNSRRERPESDHLSDVASRGAPVGGQTKRTVEAVGHRVRPPRTTRADTVTRNTSWFEDSTAGKWERTPELRRLLDAGNRGS